MRTWSRLRIFNPKELTFIQSVFDDACRTQRIGPESEDGERLAEAIVFHSQIGLSDDYRLMKALEPAIAGRLTKEDFRKVLWRARNTRRRTSLSPRLRGQETPGTPISRPSKT